LQSIISVFILFPWNSVLTIILVITIITISNSTVSYCFISVGDNNIVEHQIIIK